MATEMANTDPEGIDGVRMTWNAWPRTKVEASKCVIPIAASISPIRAHPLIPTNPYAPLRCKTCSAVLNPFCRVDFSALIWICPFCFQRNHFPHHFSGISETNVPAELYTQYTTIEYALPNHDVHHTLPPPVYIFVLDTCMIEEELGFAKSALQQALEFLPENALVGFVSFGTQVQVHELGYSDMSKVYVFRGSKEMTKDQVLDQLGLGGGFAGGRRPGGMPVPGQGFQKGPVQSNSNVTRFLLPASEGAYIIHSLLEELGTDQWPVAPGNRSLRCTGVALSVAAGLLGACLPGTGARIVALVGGPCTEGPGSIVSKDLSDPVRSHKDLDKDAAPYFRKAVQFYEELAKQMVSQGHVLDLFASALDQVGVAEMKVIIERTGGLVVLAESFGHSVFKDSFKRVFEKGEVSLGLAHNGTLEIICSKDIKIQGIIGPCTSLEKKGPAVASTVIGQGNTTAWKLCGLDKDTCLTVFFDISSSDKDPSGNVNPQLYIQTATSYQSVDGQSKLRVTTITRRWVESAVVSEELMQGFDQETAAVVMARFTSYKMESEEAFDATRWIDRNLIRLCSKFGHSHTAVPTLAVLTMLLAQPIFLSRNFPTLNNRNSRTSLQLHNPPALIRVSPQRTPIIASSGCFGCFVKPLDVRTKTSLGAFFKKRKGCAHICHSLKEESEVGGNGNNGRDWTTSILLFLLWAALMYYVFFLTPNQTPSRDTYFLKKLLNLKGDDGFRMNEVLVSLWYLMGLWPLVYSMLLLPTGRSSKNNIPVWPFLILSCFGGAYVLLPYFVLWKPPAPPVEETQLKTWPLNFLESKVTAMISLAAGVAIITYAGLAGQDVWKEFYQYFRESKFIHITSIDFIILSTFAPFWVYNDMTARKRFDKGSWLLPISLIPFLGPGLYLLLRPSLSTVAISQTPVEPE